MRDQLHIQRMRMRMGVGVGVGRRKKDRKTETESHAMLAQREQEQAKPCRNGTADARGGGGETRRREHVCEFVFVCDPTRPDR